MKGVSVYPVGSYGLTLPQTVFVEQIDIFKNAIQSYSLMLCILPRCLTNSSTSFGSN